MGKRPAVSIVIPVYKVEAFLRRCLDSVLNQTFSDWQAVCVNDGSPDACAEILAEYAARDARFTVITKENTGISDTRNVGTAVAAGEYVLYLDSDDFIHPQTLEILYSLAMQNNADMVTFKYDEKFHEYAKRLIIKGQDITGMLPDSRNAQYKVSRIKFCVTDNILFHSTEHNRSLRVRRPVRRHCFPTLCLYRRSLIADVPFIRGIIMEDFPWWCAIMLRRPRTVMVNLPLYFYMPNAGSILRSSKPLRMIESLAVGLEYTHTMYDALATPRELRHFNREFLWPFIIITMRKVRELDTDEDRRAVVGALRALRDSGVFDNPPNGRARKYSRRIDEFINRYN